MKNSRLSVRDICAAGMFTAVIVVMAQISIPMPLGVPMTMQTFAIPLATVVLGTKRGTLAALAYIVLGAVGLPVFTGFSGGLGIVLGPRGGFILSFPLMALLAGLGAESGKKWLMACALATAHLGNLLCGMLWYAVSASVGLDAAFFACVLPFLPTAALKAILTVPLGLVLRRAASRVIPKSGPASPVR